MWISETSFRGWVCSACEWNDPVPTLLTDGEAKNAYDRLAAAKFRGHECRNYLTRLLLAQPSGFTERIRKLVAKGFKPKDAVDIVLQEVSLESNGDIKLLAQARADGDDFLRRIRAGVI